MAHRCFAECFHQLLPLRFGERYSFQRLAVSGKLSVWLQEDRPVPPPAVEVIEHGDFALVGFRIRGGRGLRTGGRRAGAARRRRYGALPREAACTAAEQQRYAE